MPASSKIGPQSLLMETQWVCSWFLRLLSLSEASTPGAAPAVFICDRSPFSAVCYSNRGGVKSGHLLEPVIREQIREVRDAAGIEVYTVHVKVEEEVLWDRIQCRLRKHPERKLYNEHEREHMDSIAAFYDGFEWDLTVDNSAGDHGAGAAEEIMAKMKEISPKYREIAAAEAAEAEEAEEAEEAGGERVSLCTSFESARIGGRSFEEEEERGREGREGSENDVAATPPSRNPRKVLRETSSLDAGASPTSVLAAWQVA